VSLSGRDIICCSTHYWDERRFRKQEFMDRFAQANRVLYVEPSISMASGAEPHLRQVASNRYLVTKVEQRRPSLWLLKPPRGLPKWGHPVVERWNYRWYGHVVARAARQLGMKRPILWNYRPSFVHALGNLPHDALVIDVVDDLSAYGGGHLVHVEESIRRLVSQSDLLVVTAKTLLERYEPLARTAVHIPNGFDAGRFAIPSSTPQPDELSKLRRPLVGFVGTLFPFLDFELLEHVAEVHHDKTLVLLGPVEASSEAAVERLCRLANVVRIESKPQDEVPKYVNAFDVCINPFRKGRVADSVSPLKVYEYLALGRPVVSSPMRSLQMERAGAVVVFAEDADEFCRQIDHCLTEAVQAQTAERRAAVADYSWDGLFARLDDAVTSALAR
jgi:glycosyltransferase involved in cell wall biosynthesis